MPPKFFSSRHITPTTTKPNPTMKGTWSRNGLTILWTFMLLCLSATIYAAEHAFLRRDTFFIALPHAFSSVESLSSSRTSTTATPTNQLLPPTGTVSPDVGLMQERMVNSIVGSIASPTNIPAWLSTLQPDGKWPDSEVDYTRGCPARRANWPAQEHWQRILVMTGAWHGGLPNSEQYVNNITLRDAISRSMSYWFDRDMTNLACLDKGGTSLCPCDDTDSSLWNTNWFSNIILIPELVGQVCLLLNDTVSTSQLAKCSSITQRSFDFFYQTPRPGFLSGANILDIGKIGVDNGLLTLNDTILHDAFLEVHDEMAIHNAVKDDGIRADGSFGQHAGVLYNGNYGKDFANDILDLELVSANTAYAASPGSQKAFGTLFDANRWIVIQNVASRILHWDLSAVGRFITFPVADNQATANLKMNLTKVFELGKQWSSDPLIQFAQSISSNGNNANAGGLQGNRMFYANDYMVHRGSNYVSTLKMFSSRTLGSECVNSQNPFGFHLADGTLYTYIHGNEYEDISAAWDWNLIPGITVDYAATQLNCDHATVTGIERFVGGATTGSVGIAAMRYTNPLTKSLSWQKTWFFLEDDIQHVMISKLSSSTNATVFSVLDQRIHSGQVVADDHQVETPGIVQINSSLWHGGVGYSISALGNDVQAAVQVGQKTGSWSAIGTSTKPPATVDLFTATIEHNLSSPLAYTTFPGSTPDSFKAKSSQLRLTTVQNDADISAVFDENHNSLFATFWNTAGGAVTFNPPRSSPTTVKVDGNIVLIYNLNDGKVTVADPSQSLSNASVTLLVDGLDSPSQSTKILTFALPRGGLAGSSVSIMT